MPDYADAISAIESGGRYDILGPVTHGGDRAHGRYQVMGANIGPWTTEVFGRAIPPQEFLASPQIQDAVFKAKFGALVNKYGPAGAARAWFAGEGGMNDPNRRDVLGTSVADYENKFNKAIGGTKPVASAFSAGGQPQIPDISSAFMPDLFPQPLTSPPDRPSIPPGTAVADSFTDPAFAPRFVRLRQTQNPTNRSV